MAARLSSHVVRGRREALVALAREAHEQVGRGVVVSVPDESGVRYAPRQRIKERLAEAQADPGPLAAVLYSVDKYAPKWQAVLRVETPECCTVSIIGYDKSEMVGSVSWTPVN